MNYVNSIIYNFCSIIIDVLSSEKITINLKIFNEHYECFLFVKNKIQNSPLFIRFGLISLTLILNYLIYFRFGRGFSRLNFEQKKYIYDDLQTSRLSLKRDLLKFYKSFIVLYINKS